jgi:PAS domain S-box-containing protein
MDCIERPHRYGQKQPPSAELTGGNEELAIFRKFAESSSQGFGIGDLEGRIVYVNPALCRLFGEDKPEDLLGGNFLTYYPQEWGKQRENEVIPTLEREGHWQGEIPILARHGRSIPTLHHVFLLRDEAERPVRRAVVVTDITELKLAEEALRQSERRFRNYFDQGLIGMAVTSLDKRWLEVNDRLCEIVGYPDGKQGAGREAGYRD